MANQGWFDGSIWKKVNQSFGRSKRKRRQQIRRRLRFEALENRRLLVSDLGEIAGTVFNDLDGDNILDAGEAGIGGVTVSLTGNDDMGPVNRSEVTAADGTYRFGNLRAGTYQVLQTPPPPTGFNPTPGISPILITIDDVEAMGTMVSSIDSFDGVAQAVTATLPGMSPTSSSVLDGQSIGGSRDMEVTITSPTGTATVNSNAPFEPGVLDFNPGSTTTARYVITFDGDNDPNTFSPTGLKSGGAVDLTSGGQGTGFLLNLGFDIDPGTTDQFLTVRVFSDATNFSQAQVPLPDTGGVPSSEVFIPFNTFTVVAPGVGANFTDVGAIQLEIETTVPAIDGQVDSLGVIGPTVETANFPNIQSLPSINIEKATNGLDADTPTGPSLPVGSTATFTYAVTNTGNVPLLSVNVVDDAGTPTALADDFSPQFTGGDTNNNNQLDLDETWTFTGSRTVTQGQHTNTSRVTAEDAAGAQVTDSDPSNHLGIQAAIDIEKATNGLDADTITGPQVPVGSVVTWTYVVTNTGNIPLGSVAVTDSQGVTVNFTGGDTDADNILDLTETWTYQGTGSAVAGQYTNIGSVVGNPVDDQGNDLPGVGNVNAQDPSNYFGVQTGIDIEKATNGQDADTATGPQVQAGSTITWTYVVTNTGTTPLGNVNLTDDQGVTVNFVGGDADADNLLDVNEVWNYQGTGTAQQGQYENNGLVTANPVDEQGNDLPGLLDVNDADPSHYFGISPIISKRRFLASNFVPQT